MEVSIDNARKISIEVLDIMVSKFISNNEVVEKLDQLRYRSKIIFNPRLKTTAGRARCEYLKNEFTMELNKKVLSENPDGFRATVIHELCHLIDGIIHGKTSGHGARWQNLMYIAGENPERTHTLNCEVRRQKRYKAFCGCDEGHELTIQRIRKIQDGKRYRCKRCREPITENKNQTLSALVEQAAKKLGYT